MENNLNDIWGRIGSVTKTDVQIAVLKDEIEIAQSKLQPHDTGHLHDYIARLNDRLSDLKND